MKRPWQIWTLFLLCLAATAPAMAWLSLKALELDRAESLARRQAALEENVSLALWRMDTLMMPLLAQEAARPPQAFQAFSPTPGAGKQPGPARPSPLLRRGPEHVRLHFQAAPGNLWTSPQAPQGEARQLAEGLGLDSAEFAANESSLLELETAVPYEVLLQATPDEMLPSGDPAEFVGDEVTLDQQWAANPVVANAYGYGPSPQTEGQQAGAVPQQAMQQQVAKGQNDLELRNRALQVYASQQVRGQRSDPGAAAARSQPIQEGVSRAFWVGDKLLLARRVQMGPETLVQGCWLDWHAIQTRLHDEVRDLVPGLSLKPVRSENDLHASRALATLPVQVEAPLPMLNERAWSPIRLSLIVAWSCLSVAALAMALLLAGVVSLSERRAAFVAAVTHELRTPLTTFRMYSEMLAQGMAPPEKRQQYLETLQVEADRLTHLVENVLSYARLERGARGGRRIAVRMEDLLSQWAPRLADRAAQADLELVVDAGEAVRDAVVSTDPQAVGQILFNLVDNAAKYARQADCRRIDVSCILNGKTANIRVRDHGPGLSPSQRRRLFRPFSKTVQEAAVTAPGVGLGLALCRRLAHDLGGRLELEASAPPGAAFILKLPLTSAS